MGFNTSVAYLLQGAALGLTAAAAPGPFQTYLVHQTLGGGWRYGLPVAFSLFISDPPIVIGALFILNQMPPGFIEIIRLIGGVYAIYLAWDLWRQTRRGGYKETRIDPSNTQESESEENFPEGQKSKWEPLRRGALMNLLSPGPYTFWLTLLGPLLLGAFRENSTHGVAFLLGFYGTMMIGLISLVMIFNQAKRLGSRVVDILSKFSILVLALFGAVLIWQGWRGLLQMW